MPCGGIGACEAVAACPAASAPRRAAVPTARRQARPRLFMCSRRVMVSDYTAKQEVTNDGSKSRSRSECESCSCHAARHAGSPACRRVPTSRRRARCALASTTEIRSSRRGIPATGDLRGITVDLSRELGRRIGVPVELVPYDAAGKMTDALKTGAWDVAFLAVDPTRAEEISFTAPYLEIEGTYLVPAGVADSHDCGRGPRGRAHRGGGEERLRSFPEPHPDARANRARADGPRSGRHVHVGQARSRRRRQAGARHGRREDSRLPRARGSVHGDSRRRRAFRRAATPAREYLREFIEDAKASGLVAEALEEERRRRQRDDRAARADSIVACESLPLRDHGGQARTQCGARESVTRRRRSRSAMCSLVRCRGRTSSTCCTRLPACSRATVTVGAATVIGGVF